MADRFDDLVAEGANAPITGWDFSWLEGRAVEERPSWRYFDRVAERAAVVASMVDLQAGSGAMLTALPARPPLAVATEGWAPTVGPTAARLRAAGAHLVATAADRPALPLATGAFELVTSRHPIDPWWGEIARVLRPGGTYLAQHVGPGSVRALSEAMLGPLPPGDRRDPEQERRGAEAAGLVVRDLRVERPRTAFFDVGAVVYYLRLVVWIVPGFTVDRYREQLRAVHEVIRREGAFEAPACRVLFEATKG